jgi:hypothetical protein
MQRGVTGLGYVYYRDRSNGTDVTVYEHQLAALMDCDPQAVFDPDTHVHHASGMPADNRPCELTVAGRHTHDGMDHCIDS